MALLLNPPLSFLSSPPLVEQVSDEDPMDEGEKTPEPLPQLPTSPPPSITTHIYTAASVFPSSSSATHYSPRHSQGVTSKRRAGRNEDIARLSIGNKPELYADITVSPPTPGELCVCVCVCVCVRACAHVCVCAVQSK